MTVSRRVLKKKGAEDSSGSATRTGVRADEENRPVRAVDAPGDFRVRRLANASPGSAPAEPKASSTTDAAKESVKIASQVVDAKSFATELRLSKDAAEFLSKAEAPCIYFDAETGRICYIETDDRPSRCTLECSHCGTTIQFETDKCPICGTQLDAVDSGIVSLFANMKFDDSTSQDIDCPSCGEQVTLVDGRCPVCGEAVDIPDSTDTDEKVDPVVRKDNIVFLHLDVESGELSYLQKLARKLGFEQQTISLDRGNDVGRDIKRTAKI